MTHPVAPYSPKEISDSQQLMVITYCKYEEHVQDLTAGPSRIDLVQYSGALSWLQTPAISNDHGQNVNIWMSWNFVTCPLRTCKGSEERAIRIAAGLSRPAIHIEIHVTHIIEQSKHPRVCVHNIDKVSVVRPDGPWEAPVAIKLRSSWIQRCENQ